MGFAVPDLKENVFGPGTLANRIPGSYKFVPEVDTNIQQKNRCYRYIVYTLLYVNGSENVLLTRVWDGR
jgi:hypothetical protein